MSKGRTKGTPNIKAVQVVEASRCAHCGSTEREPYTNTTEQEFGGVTAEGEPFTHIVRRRTRCLNCTLPRIDLNRENRPGAAGNKK